MGLQIGFGHSAGSAGFGLRQQQRQAHREVLVQSRRKGPESPEVELNRELAEQHQQALRNKIDELTRQDGQIYGSTTLRAQLDCLAQQYGNLNPAVLNSLKDPSGAMRFLPGFEQMSPVEREKILTLAQKLDVRIVDQRIDKAVETPSQEPLEQALEQKQIKSEKIPPEALLKQSKPADVGSKILLAWQLHRLLKNRPDLLEKAQAVPILLSTKKPLGSSVAYYTTTVPFVCLTQTESLVFHYESDPSTLFHEETHALDHLPSPTTDEHADGLLPDMTPKQAKDLQTARAKLFKTYQRFLKNLLPEEKENISCSTQITGEFRQYAFTDNQEFLAEAVEVFMDPVKTQDLRKNCPLLYNTFRDYFKLDPAQEQDNKQPAQK